MALSKANGEQYDCISEEMSKFARENIGAIEALNIALNVTLDGTQIISSTLMCRL